MTTVDRVAPELVIRLEHAIVATVQVILTSRDLLEIRKCQRPTPAG
jgi:hypothetical protein